MANIKQGVRINQREITRALKAARAAGLNVSRIDIGPDGKLSILVAGAALAGPPLTPFDAWKEKRNARSS